MEKLKQHIQNGNLELAQLNQNNVATSIPYQQLKWKVDLNNRLAQVTKKLKKLNWEEKYQWVHVKKLRGNKYYAQKKYNQAIQVYVQSFMGLDLEDKSRIKIVKQQLQYPTLLNIATCYFKLQQYEKGVQFCQIILRETEHDGAYYKKGTMQLKLGRKQQGRKSLERASILTKDSSLKQSIKIELGNLQIQNKQKSELYKKMLNIQETSENTKLLPSQNEEQILFYQQKNICQRIYDSIQSVILRITQKNITQNNTIKKQKVQKNKKKS